MVVEVIQAAADLKKVLASLVLRNGDSMVCLHDGSTFRIFQHQVEFVLVDVIYHLQVFCLDEHMKRKIQTPL
jgi:hypothetical protein